MTHVLNAFFFAAVLRGSGNCTLQAAFDRLLFAVVLVGLPASVASLVAAVAAVVHFVRQLRNAAVCLLPVHAFEHLARNCALVAAPAGAAASATQPSAAIARIHLPFMTSPPSPLHGRPPSDPTPETPLPVG